MSEIYINYTDIFETSHPHLQQYEIDLDTYENGTIKEIAELMNNLNHKYTSYGTLLIQFLSILVGQLI